MRYLGELEFIASHFDDFLPRPQTLTTLYFSFLYEILAHRSLRIENEDSLYDFIRKGTKMNPEMICLLEFVRFEYCPTDVMNDLFDLLWENSYEINASMWATLRVRLLLPCISKRQAKQFSPLVKRGKAKDRQGRRMEFDVPHGIIAHLTRECSRNVHDRGVVEVTCGSFEKENYEKMFNMLQKMPQIWKLIPFSFQLIARRKKILLTRGTIGCDTISRKGGLCQHTTQSTWR
jgi:hypothetical protein